MKRYFGIIIAVIALISFGCKGEGDVLATYKGGEITRGNLYQWLDSRHLTKEPVLQRKAKQKIKLKQIALERLIVREASKAGYDKNESFKELIDTVYDNYITSYFRRKIRDDVNFKENASKVSIIKFSVKTYKLENNKRKDLSEAEKQKELQAKLDEAKAVVDKLKSGDKFGELAEKHSSDYSKKKGGDIGFITSGMRSPEFMKAIGALKVNEYTKEPVEIRNAVYILKVTDRRELTPDNIGDVIENEAKAKRLKRRLQLNVAKNLENKLVSDKDIVDNIDKASLKDNNAVLFQVGETKYTTDALNKTIDFFNLKRKRSGRKATPFDEKKKRDIAKKIFKEKLFKREAIKRKIDKDEDFTQKWVAYKEFTLSNEYKNEIIMKDIDVKPEEVKAEYDKNKDRVYTKKEKKGNKVVKTVKAFGEVKEKIEFMLKNRKKSFKRRKWEKDLLKNNEFTIDESELEGDENQPKKGPPTRKAPSKMPGKMPGKKPHGKMPMKMPGKMPGHQ